MLLRLLAFLFQTAHAKPSTVHALHSSLPFPLSSYHAFSRHGAKRVRLTHNSEPSDSAVVTFGGPVDAEAVFKLYKRRRERGGEESLVGINGWEFAIDILRDTYWEEEDERVERRR